MHALRCISLLHVVLMAAALPAQRSKLPDPARADQELQLLPVGDVLSAGTASERRAAAATLAHTLRRLVRPALREDEDVAALGVDRIAVLGRAAQQGWIADVLRRRRRGEAQSIDVQVELLTIPAAAFDRHLAARLPATEPEVVAPGDARLLGGLPRTVVRGLPAATAPNGPAGAALRAALRAARGHRLGEAIRVSVPSLGTERATAGTTLTYVRDYEVQRVRGRTVVDPVIDRILDGTAVTATAAVGPAEELSVWLEVSWRSVERPLRDFTTTLAGSTEPLVLQLPQWRSLDVEQSLTLRSGDETILALPQQSGHRRVVIVRAELKQI